MLLNWKIDREVAISTPTVYLRCKVLKLILRMFFSVASIKDGANKETVFPPLNPLENEFNESDELFVVFFFRQFSTFYLDVFDEFFKKSCKRCRCFELKIETIFHLRFFL